MPIKFCFVGPPILQYFWTKTKKFDVIWFRSNSVRPQISKSKDEPRLAHTWIGKAHVTLENCPNQMPIQLGSIIIWKSILIYYYVSRESLQKSSTLQIFPKHNLSLRPNFAFLLPTISIQWTTWVHWNNLHWSAVQHKYSLQWFYWTYNDIESMQFAVHVS